MVTVCQPITVLIIYFTLVHYGRMYMASAPPPSAGNGKSKTGGRGPVDLAHRPWFILLLFTYNMSMSALNAWISFEVKIRVEAGCTSDSDHCIYEQLLYCGLKRHYNFLCQLVYRQTD